jgi:AAA ATPase domain
VSPPPTETVERDLIDDSKALNPATSTWGGEPGRVCEPHGKSRLVHELSRIVEADPEMVTWRQGRCLAYGEEVAFWALAEVVKAQAGIVEHDSGEGAAEKLRAATFDVIDDDSEARWVESHLRPLVGLEAGTGLGGDRRGEAFAAWRRFLEGIADKRPFVLVLEDLHWADDGLLDLPSSSSATSSPSRTARTGNSARKPTCGVMSQPRRLRTRSGSSVETIARKPSHLTS